MARRKQRKHKQFNNNPDLGALTDEQLLIHRELQMLRAAALERGHTKGWASKRADKYFDLKWEVDNG